jgi:hypothetical protein
VPDNTQPEPGTASSPSDGEVDDPHSALIHQLDGDKTDRRFVVRGTAGQPDDRPRLVRLKDNFSALVAPAFRGSGR